VSEEQDRFEPCKSHAPTVLLRFESGPAHSLSDDFIFVVESKRRRPVRLPRTPAVRDCLSFT